MADTEFHEHFLEQPEIETRAPLPEDLDALVEIDAGWRDDRRRAYLESRLRRATRPSGISLARVAEQDGEIVGFLLGEVTRGEFGRVESQAWIDTFGVKKSAARRGIGSLLLKDFMRHAQILGALRVRTLLEPEDEVLADFLQAHEFSVAATQVVEHTLEAAP